MRRLAGGSQAASEAVKQVAKTKTLLQNRLEQAEKKFGEALTRNNELRAAIEEQNKSREAFEQVGDGTTRLISLFDVFAEVAQAHDHDAVNNHNHLIDHLRSSTLPFVATVDSLCQSMCVLVPYVPPGVFSTGAPAGCSQC